MAYTFSFEDEWWAKVKKEYDKVYSRALAETQAKFDAYMAQFHDEDEQKKKDVAAGLITQEQYGAWLVGKVEGGKRWREMRDTILHDLNTTNRKALEIANGYMPFAFVGGYNEVGQMGLVRGYSFNLVDAGTVNKLILSNKSLLPKMEINGKKQNRWNDKLLRAEITQGVIQGESIPKIAKRLENVFGKNERGWLNNARTAMTMAENQGRQSSYEQMEEDGIELGKQWIATHDRRVRKSHQHIDGEIVKVKEEFSNGLMYPGDPDGDPEEVYGCRCTMVAEVLGFRKLKYSKKRAEREERVAVGNAIYDKKDELDAFTKQAKEDGLWEYDGIWKDPVTLEDYEAKAGSIDAKMDYFADKLDWLEAHGKGMGDPEYMKFYELMQDLENFKTSGKEYSQIQGELNGLLERMAGIGNAGGSPAQVGAGGGGGAGGPFTPDAYSQERKDGALWFRGKSASDTRRANDAFMPTTSRAWLAATEEEKDAAFMYTYSYSPFNEPLRGVEYGTGVFKGVGRIDFDEIGTRYKGFQRGAQRARIQALTRFIDRSPIQQDTWFNRGVYYDGMERFFQCDMSLLLSGSDAELKKELLGKTCTEHAFMSTSPVKGLGFSGRPIMLNIYAPKGTKACYIEPFSQFGRVGRSWDGVTPPSSFGGEFETLFQQGTQFRVTNVYRKNGVLYFDLDVIGQGAVQK